MGAVVDNNTVIIDLPAKTMIKVVGLSNSGWWGQKILVVTPVAGPYVWEQTGAQLNTVLGTVAIEPMDQPSSMKVQLYYQPENSDWIFSQIEVTPYTAEGLTGYVVGGQDGGGRPNGPAFDNTVVFVYWAVGY